jgi:hypothetical protein
MGRVVNSRRKKTKGKTQSKIGGSSKGGNKVGSGSGSTTSRSIKSPGSKGSGIKRRK